MVIAQMLTRVLQHAVRKTMLIAMGLGAKARAKDVAKMPSHPSGGGCVKDREMGRGQFIRPDWQSNSAGNAYIQHNVILPTEGTVHLAVFKFW